MAWMLSVTFFAGSRFVSASLARIIRQSTLALSFLSKVALQDEFTRAAVRKRGPIVSVVLIGCAVLATAKTSATPIHLERVTEAMGTTFTIEMYGADRTSMDSAANDAFAEVHRLDLLLSNYIPNSELSILNQRAAEAPVKISSELFDLLKVCMDYSRQSEGTFDITVGPLMKVWGFYKDSGHLASPDRVRSAMQDVGWRNVSLDPATLSVRFRTRGVNLDLGGVGKGYAVDRMVQILKRDGIRSALVSAGGSSIYGIGAPPDDPNGWSIRIRDPRNEENTAGHVDLKDASISTSGGYEKFFWADGKLYSHIMDPRTGFPAEGMLSVSIVAPQTLDSEIWAKPYYILGRAWTEQHKAKQFRVFLCENKAGVNCSWLP
jgi:FAD:protein FMN transferase